MSESPGPMQGEYEKQERRAEETVNFRFCRECSNMLYPRENRETSTLMYRCRTCNYEEVATSYCVFRNQLSTQIMETAGVTTEVGSDPTLPRAKKHCTRCDGDESVFFQSQQRTADTKMKLFYVCCQCGNIME